MLTTTTSADAATWHKGMPAALRGTWKAKHTGPAAPNNNIIKIWSTSYAWSPSYTHSRNTRYAYLGHHKYRILEDVSWSKKNQWVPPLSGIQNITSQLVAGNVIAKIC
ncbi:hypothetical protein [Secundilactobacillus kimchicus]|uniref:hypothetical protein n=1 Tax=Secundilactobacillus kimchicus TaxID=528209 RepID=UPI0024374414|nr:hypothetical protein [Secundilactobacillus kimchicus]